MHWHYVTWAAGAATMAALAIACLPLVTTSVAPAAGKSSPRRAEPAPASGTTPASGTAAAASDAAAHPARVARVARVPAAAGPGRTAPTAVGVLVILVVLVATELTFDGLVDPPAWVRAGWATTTAVAAAWLAAHCRELTIPAQHGTLRTGGAGTPTGPTGPADADLPATARMTDPLSEQDDLVQTLVVASYALQMGDEPRARQAVDGALRRSRATLDELMRQRGCHGLVRAAPATGGRNSPKLY